MFQHPAPHLLLYQWTTSQPTGIRTITHRGTLPLMVRNFAGTVRLKRADAAALTVVPLDFNGYRLPGPPGHAAAIPLAPSNAYYLIER